MIAAAPKMQHGTMRPKGAGELLPVVLQSQANDITMSTNNFSLVDVVIEDVTMSDTNMNHVEMKSWFNPYSIMAR